MHFSELLKAVAGARCQLPQDPKIESVVSDSRQVGPDALFVAIRGTQVDGHRHIREALERGAVAVIAQEGADWSPEPGLPHARVPDSRVALAWLSAASRGYPARQLSVIGVTGTDGKTTTVHLIRSILRAASYRVGAISTMGATINGDTMDTGLHTTTPDAPQVQSCLARMVETKADYAIIEATSHGLAQRRVEACEWDVAVVTNITHEHLDYHDSREAYQEAKTRLFRDLARAHRKPQVSKVAILNADDSSYAYLRSIPADRHLSYGILSQADVMAKDIVSSAQGTRFQAIIPDRVLDLETPLLGDFNLSNILAAVTVGVSQDLPLDAIREGVRSMRAVPGRMEAVHMGQDFNVLVDFAHTPNSLEKALATARKLAPGQLLVVFGCAGLRDRAKRPLMGEIAGRYADSTIITAEDPRTEDLQAIMDQIAAGCTKSSAVEGLDYWLIPDRAEAITFALNSARRGDTVLIAGKGHERSMCFGETEVPWSDQETAREALRLLLAR